MAEDAASGTDDVPKKAAAEYVANAMDDVRQLMEFLGRAEDGRLQAHFDDVTKSGAVSYARRSVAPVSSYREFLQRIDEIQTMGIRPPKAATGASPGGGGSSPDGAAPAGPLSDAAFVLWARDFLAVVAAPATADSIRLTRAYVDARAMPVGLLGWVATRPPANGAQSCNAGCMAGRRAGKLARTVSCLHLQLSIVIVVTLVVSVYALAGKAIVSGREDAMANIRSIYERLLALDAHNPAQPPPAQGAQGQGAQGQGGGGAAQSVRGICDQFQLAGQDTNDLYRQGASFGPIPNGVVAEYRSSQAMDLCRQRRRALVQLFATGEQLLAWQRVATNIALVGPLFGRSSELTGEFAADPLVCQNFTGKRPFVPVDANGAVPTGADAKKTIQAGKTTYVLVPTVQQACENSLQQMVEYYGKIPDAILGCITLYILPTLYGWIGAVVFALRRIVTRVEASLLGPTDRGVILQSKFLGVAAGAVIGLFASYITKASGAESIGLSALAFLAGYNVAGLFAMLDGLSARLFSVTSGPVPAK